MEVLTRLADLVECCTASSGESSLEGHAENTTEEIAYETVRQMRQVQQT
jgi:hypothetical protein